MSYSLIVINFFCFLFSYKLIRGPFIRWTDQGPNEIIGLLQKGVITMARAAELMNASPSTINGYSDHVIIINLLSTVDF